MRAAGRSKHGGEASAQNQRDSEEKEKAVLSIGDGEIVTKTEAQCFEEHHPSCEPSQAALEGQNFWEAEQRAPPPMQEAAGGCGAMLGKSALLPGPLSGPDPPSARVGSGPGGHRGPHESQDGLIPQAGRAEMRLLASRDVKAEAQSPVGELVQCERSFLQPASLAAPQACSEGGQSFREQLNPLRPHSKAKPYQCGQCGQSFLHRSRLTYHARTHTGERPYACAQCGKCYSRKEHLRNHQRLHTGERPYRCQECGKLYSRKEYLQHHRRVHTGERPFQCAACGKSFMRKQNLLKHQRIHTGERPYQCGECGRSFRYKESLKDHQRTHRAEPGLPPGRQPALEIRAPHADTSG